MNKEKNVPKLRYKKQNGDIYPLWNTYPINKITSYVDYRGKTPKKVDSGIFLVTAKNIKDGIIDYECSKEYVREVDYKSIMSRGLPVVGDVVITTEAPLGNVAQIDKPNIALAQRVIKYSGKKGVLNNTYLKYAFLSNSFQNKLLIKATGGTVKGIKGSVLHKLDICIPVMEEQTKIANFLTTLDSRISLQSQKVKKLEKLKKGYMQKIFSQELRFKREDGSEYGKWEEKRLGELEDSGDVRLGRGNVIPKGECIKGYPVYSSSVKNGGLFTYNETFMFDKELITWSIDGGGNFFYRPKHKFSVTNVSGVLEVLSKNIDVRFLYEMLSDRHSRLTFDYLTKAHPSVIRTLYAIELPELEEQTKIASFLSSFDNQIGMEKKELEKLQELKKGLLRQMFV